MIDCRTMTGTERYDAFELMKQFRSDEAALGDALSLFIDRQDYGFVWLAYVDDVLAACVSVGFAISSERGGIVADLRDLWVEASFRRAGVASALLATLHGRLDHLEVRRIAVALPDDAGLRGFFAARGYQLAAGVQAHLDR